ncbi:hypothetical protein S245_062904, partial [Arachis hypogaea]
GLLTLASKPAVGGLVSGGEEERNPRLLSLSESSTLAAGAGNLPPLVSPLSSPRSRSCSESADFASSSLF